MFAAEPNYQGKTAAGWINQVVEDRKFDNSKAIEALREIGPNAVPPLVQLFNQIASWNEERARQTNGGAFDDKWSYALPAFACRALEELGADAKDEIPHLIELTQKAKPPLVWPLRLKEVIKADRDDAALSQMLLKELQAADERLSQTDFRGPSDLFDYFRALGLVQAVGELRTNGTAMVPFLKKWMDDEKKGEWIQAHAAASLWRITGETNTTVPILFQYPKTGKYLAPVAAADVFGEMGPAARFAVPELTKALTFWRENGTNEARSRIMDFFAHGDVVPMDLHAARALWRIERKPDSILPLLTNNLVGSNGNLSREILEEIGPAEAFPTLFGDLKNSYTYDERIILAIGKMGETARPAMPYLRLAMRKKSELMCVRLAAAEALLNIEPVHEPVLPELIEWLKTGGVYTRVRSAELLGRMGSAAKEAVPALKPLLDNENPRIRAGVADALKKIESAAAK